jgi:O-antigen/teichoic acid export membrane protein
VNARTVKPRACDVLRNTFLNLLGLGLPLVVAIITIPLLIASLGVERFGILTLIQNDLSRSIG